MAKVVTPGVSDLPPEFQSQADEVARQGRLAELLLQRGMEKRATGNMVGRMYVPDVWGKMADTFARVMGSRADANAIAARSKLSQDYSRAQAGATEQLLRDATAPVVRGGAIDGSEDPQYPDTHTSIQQGLTSSYPKVQALAKALQEQRTKAFELGFKDATPVSRELATAHGMDPRRLVQESQDWGAPRVMDTGIPLASGQGNLSIYAQTGPRGEVKVLGKNNDGTSVNVDTRGQLDLGKDDRANLTKQLDDQRAEALKRGLADIPQRTMVALRALELLNDGAIDTGTGSGFLTALKKSGGLFGFKVDPSVSETETYNTFVKQYLPQLLAGFAPISEGEVKLAMQQLATSDMSPIAAKQVLSSIINSAQRAMTDYNRRVEATARNMDDLRMGSAPAAMANILPFPRYFRPGAKEGVDEGELVIDALERFRNTQQVLPPPYQPLQPQPGDEKPRRRTWGK